MVDMHAIEAIIQIYGQELAEQHPVHLYEIAADFSADNTLKLKGRVLLEYQKKEIIKRIRPVWTGRIENNIVSSERLDFLWAHSSVPLLHVYEDMVSERLATQYRPDEWLKVLAGSGKYRLVLGEDMAMGWVIEEHVIYDLQEGHENKWLHLQIPRGSAADADMDEDELIRTATSYLEIPYLRGGRSRQAVDCSAFLQLVFLETAGLLLPRHSWEQKECGSSVAITDTGLWLAGDAVFGISKRSNQKHVGLCIGENQIIHASRRMGSVVIWDLDTFCKLYAIQAVRRFVRQSD
ncbi:MAG TPA: NlpC/P60 family protein [bacterium]|nr:NlpC/P60 family protein [bacterium]